MSLETVIYTRSQAHAGLSALISTRLYFHELPQNATLPAVMYARVHSERPSCMGDDAGLARVRMQFDAYASTAKAARGVIEQLRDCFQRWSNTSGTVVQDTYVLSEADLGPDPDTREYHSTIDFEFVHQE